MGLRSWITERASKTAEAVVERTKDTFQRNMENHVVKRGEAWYTIGKVALMALILLMTGKEVSTAVPEHQKRLAEPQQMPTITINNYIHENERRSSSDHKYRSDAE